MFTRKPVTQNSRQAIDKPSGGNGLSLPAIPAFQKQEYPSKVNDPHPAGNRTIQPKLKSYVNPFFTANNIPVPDAGKTRVADDATYMSGEVDAAKVDLESLVEKYNNGDDVTSEMNAINARAGGQKKNLNNRLFEWKKFKGTSRKSNKLKMCLGYIVECFVKTLAAARTGVNIQVVMGGARPDFQVQTGEIWQHNTMPYDANGLIDITSANEASKGHILDKITRVEDEDAINNPHLYDVYYDTIQIPGAVKDLTDKQADSPSAIALEKRYHELMILKNNRKKSLRTKEERESKRDVWKNRDDRDDREGRRKDRSPSRSTDRRKRRGSTSVESNDSSHSRERSRSDDKNKKDWLKMHGK